MDFPDFSPTIVTCSVRITSVKLCVFNCLLYNVAEEKILRSEWIEFIFIDIHLYTFQDLTRASGQGRNPLKLAPFVRPTSVIGGPL